MEYQNRRIYRGSRGMLATQTMGRMPAEAVKTAAAPVLCAYPCLATVYAPYQSFADLYDIETALRRGTAFAALDLPFAPGKRCQNG